MNDTRVKDLLHSAVGLVPPATYDLDAAVRSGRRRRIARTSATLATTTAVVTIMATGTWALVGPSRSTEPTVAGASSPSVASTAPSVQATSTTATRITLSQLEKLARQVAVPSGGNVTVASSEETVPGDGSLIRVVRLHVAVAGTGTFDVAATMDTNAGNSVAAWAEGCKHEGHACTPILQTPVQGVWSRSYDSQKGRRSLMLAAALPTGDILTIKVDNYTEQPGGSKAVGPAWSTVGITARTLTDAAATVTTAT
jgi:hypothetical protein